ncbi:hypothetical protein C1878_01200 [Gordonibacter sp. 28C]|nr:hypothetical protein C1878_01200 [Gordonibacter sp. 28C]
MPGAPGAPGAFGAPGAWGTPGAGTAPARSCAEAPHPWHFVEPGGFDVPHLGHTRFSVLAAAGLKHIAFSFSVAEREADRLWSGSRETMPTLSKRRGKGQRPTD